MTGLIAELDDGLHAGHAGTRSLLDETLEALIHWVEQAYGNEEIVRAKEDFFARIGKVFSDDAHYMYYMTFFLDYLLFERPASIGFSKSLSTVFPDIAPGDLTPFFIARRAKPWPSAATMAPAVKDLRGFRHSVYEVISVEKTKAIFKDLLSGEKVEVTARAGESLAWIARKDCLQTHLYEWGDVLHLSEGVIGHPSIVKRTVAKKIKSFKKEAKRSSTDLLLGFAFAKLKLFRLKTMSAKQIYSEI